MYALLALRGCDTCGDSSLLYLLDSSGPFQRALGLIRKAAPYGVTVTTWEQGEISSTEAARSANSRCTASLIVSGRVPPTTIIFVRLHRIAIIQANRAA